MIYQMFTLVTDRSKYFRVKRGQTKSEVEAAFRIPIKNFFCGAIAEIGEEMEVYTCKPLENYNSVSLKFGVSAEELKRLNFSKPLYPSCKLFVPCKK
ncbi:MAG: hypothetical protein K2O89_07740 [Clostridia bacterium]|nr:hypothetical protein [Clostridia bacterium]